VSLVAIVVVGYVAWAALLFFMQRSMMFPGAGMAGGDSRVGAPPPAGVEEVWIDTPAGAVEAWFLPADGAGTSPAAIFAHGNAELIDYAIQDARDLRDIGLSVLLVEYPGYGRSAGRPARRSIGDVFLAAYDQLVARPDIDNDRIVGLGRSLGAGAISDLARDRPLRALVLQSPFTSVADLAKRYFLPPILVRDAFDNAAVLSTFPGPVLLIHGTRDRMIPHSNSERLARVAAASELLSLECGHNDCPPDRAAYMTALDDFLERADVLPAESRGTGDARTSEHQ
jgi:hypothetical protein